MKTKLEKISTLEKVTSYRTIPLEVDVHTIGESFINNKGETIAVECNCKVNNFHPVMNGGKICCDINLSAEVMSDPFMMELGRENMIAFCKD